ncbi:unnamed protein product [Mytilus coruscus]|uniref:SAP domain-containing protein n=1 Tax=Mytilus coruscus TaxID=42192 RepID=A0A6J8DQ90_MYTCO|nr:unnamed protein product [Mytilus coruscus]
MESDFSTWKKKELQDFLKKCNQPTFGNKPELIERAKGAKALGLDINNNAPRVLDDIKSSLLTPLGENLPSPSELKEGWSSNCDQFPDFTHKELYNFLVLSRHRSYDASEMGARRQLKAKVFYQEGHISDIKCHQISAKCSHCIIKCHCLPSIPTKDKKKKPAYQTWVFLSKVTGRVHNAECNCVAGLKITKDECSKIEMATREQHKNPLWKHVRRGRLTASKFGNIVRRKADTEPDNLIKYLLEYTPSFTNAAISWGRDHEQIAIDSYLIRVRESHPPLTATQNGVIINEHLPHLGATPDGLIYCPHCKPYHGVIEVKCPYALRDLHPLEAARQSNFFCEVDSLGRLRLKRSHSYYYQVQGQLAITKRTWCHFVVWTNKGMEFEIIYWDKELWEKHHVT